MTWQEERSNLQTRLQERFGVALPQALTDALPGEVIRDTLLNLSKALDGDATLLSKSDRLLLGFAVAAAAGGGLWAQWLQQAALAAGQTQETCEAARAVALTCATHNGYYKFRALLESNAHDAFSPGLRATPFVKSILSKTLVELMCIAISVQNGCTHCVQGHVQAAHQAGANAAQIDDVVRIGAVVGALTQFTASV